MRHGRTRNWTAKCWQWLTDSSAALAPLSLGHYINEVDVRGGSGLVSSGALPPRRGSRLEDLRADRDPNGRFCGFLGE